MIRATNEDLLHAMIALAGRCAESGPRSNPRKVRAFAKQLAREHSLDYRERGTLLEVAERFTAPLEMIPENDVDRRETGELEIVADAARTSSVPSEAVLAQFARELLGQRPEPWLELEGLPEQPEAVTVTSEPIPRELVVLPADGSNHQLSSALDPSAPLSPRPRVLAAAAFQSVQQLSLESTTLLSTAGMSTPPRPGRRWMFMLGSILFVGAVVAGVVEFAVGSLSSGGNVASYNDIVALRRSQEVSGAAASQVTQTALDVDAPTKHMVAPIIVPPSELPSAPSTNRSAASTPTLTAASAPANSLDSECRAYRAARRWTALMLCAERMKPIDAARAAEFETRAVEEISSAPHSTAITTALRNRNLKQARAELDKVWNGSIDYAGLKRAYDRAETQEIDALATQLDSVKDTACSAYNALLAKARLLNPPRVLAEATHRVRCTPQPKCDADALANQGGRQFSVVQLAESLASYEAAYACQPAATLLQKQFVVACNLHNEAKARSLWKRLPEALRTRALLSVCRHNGITEVVLSSP